MNRIMTIGSLFLIAAATPARAVDTAKVDEAVKKGAEYLKSFHGGGVNGGTHGAGSVALSGMALLASGATAKDPTIIAIANSLRPQVFTDEKTYNNALMVLFFDKLGLPEDEGLIQLLGVKLLVGQNSQGGWGYNTWPSNVPLDGARWAASFRNWKFDGRMHPEIAKLYQSTRGGNGVGNTGGSMMTDDNSNTQFALIATWVAARHAIPIRDAANRLDNRFLRTQDPQNGGWGYSGVASGSTPSMTCAGLLGLAVSFASKSTVQMESNAEPKTEEDDPFSKPPTGAGGDKKPGEGDKEAAPPTDMLAARRKAAIDRGLAALGRTLAQNQPRNAGGGVAPGGFGGANDLYFFWSVERVGVAYGIEQIGKVDWYEWGAPMLLASQATEGSWSGTYGNEVSTSFAILFLTRTNFAVDLSAKLKGKGFGGELRGGGIPQMKAIPFAEQKAPVAAEPGKPPPNISGIREVTQADGLADALLALSDKDFPAKLKEYQAAKGEQYTAAIAFALNRLEKDKKKLARNALVERLVRMTPDTLKAMCKINDSEMRRAAVLACASKDDKSHIPDLISRINDPDDDVVNAARAGLKSLTNEDFGPLPGATEEDKSAVSIKWRHWLSAKGSGKPPGN